MTALIVTSTPVSVVGLSLARRSAGLGWAREAKVSAAKPAPVEKVVDAPKPAAKKAAKKQTYRTRDMKAKG